MPDLQSISFETKWRIASRASGHLAALCSSIFRPALNERYDDLEREVWIRMAEYSREVALSLKLQVRNARELAESLRLVNAVIFGPDFKEEVIEVGEDGAVIIVRRCPHITGADASEGNGIFHRCMAFTLSSQKALNPAFSSRYVRAMCMGDRQCEIRVAPEKELEENTPGKKT